VGEDDPHCVPQSPYRVTYQDIAVAATLIKGGVKETPCSYSSLSNLCDMEIYLKKEFLQPTGSSEDRGARNALLQLTEHERETGVITSSPGNHSQALSYHAAKLGIPCTVILPITTPIMKVQKCQAYGANVIVSGKDLCESRDIAYNIAKTKSLIYINGYDHPHVIAGQGTIGLEICDQVKDADAVIIPVGGGGLIAGISTAVKAINPKIQVIGVESKQAPGFSNAMRHGSPILTTVKSTLADDLAIPIVGYNSFASTVRNIDKMIAVSEDLIALAILKLVEIEKCVVEGAGAIGLAAILSGSLDELRGKHVVVVLSGGNIDTPMFGRCLEQGLVKDGRLLKFDAIISDRPGGLSALCSILAELGVSIKDVNLNESAWASNVNVAKARVLIETRDHQHSEIVEKALTEKYGAVFCKPDKENNDE
jgi:threonine dehydratase